MWAPSDVQSGYETQNIKTFIEMSIMVSIQGTEILFPRTFNFHSSHSFHMYLMRNV